MHACEWWPHCQSEYVTTEVNTLQVIASIFATRVLLQAGSRCFAMSAPAHGMQLSVTRHDQHSVAHHGKPIAQPAVKNVTITHLVETAVEIPRDSMKHMALVVW